MSHPTPWPPPLQGAGEDGRGVLAAHAPRVPPGRPVSPLSLRERGAGGRGRIAYQKAIVQASQTVKYP